MNDVKELNNKLAEYLKISTLSLGTVGKSDQPHNAPVYFVADDQVNLYFFSKSDSQHIIDILRNPKSSAAIYPECYDWKEIRGIQLRGIVKIVNSKRKTSKVIKLFTKKFPFSLALLTEFDKNELYMFVPTWVRIIDNRISFGFKEEISIREE